MSFKVSNSNEIWLFCLDKKMLRYSLLMQGIPVEEVVWYKADLDNNENPHLIIEKNCTLYHSYWNGKEWMSDKIPTNGIFNTFFLTFQGKDEGHILLANAKYPTCYEHFVHTANGWVKKTKLTIPENSILKGIFVGENGLLHAIYCVEASYNGYIGIVSNQNNNWCDATVINIYKQKMINWFFTYDRLYFLLSEKTLQKSIISIVNLPLNEIENYDVNCLGEIGDWDDSPFIYNDSRGLVILWSYRGYLYLAKLNSADLTIDKIIKSDIFYPAGLLLGDNRISNKTALRLVYGNKLHEPLMLTIDDLEKTMKMKVFFDPPGH